MICSPTKSSERTRGVKTTTNLVLQLGLVQSQMPPWTYSSVAAPKWVQGRTDRIYRCRLLALPGGQALGRKSGDSRLTQRSVMAWPKKLEDLVSSYAYATRLMNLQGLAPRIQCRRVRLAGLSSIIPLHYLDLRPLSSCIVGQQGVLVKTLRVLFGLTGLMARKRTQGASQGTNILGPRKSWGSDSSNAVNATRSAAYTFLKGHSVCSLC